MHFPLAAECQAAGQHKGVSLEDGVADADVGRTARFVRARPILILGRQVLLVHQLDEHRIAGLELLEFDVQPVRGERSSLVMP